LQGEPEGRGAEVARRRDRLAADRPRQVFAEADEEGGLLERGLRRGGTEEQRPRRRDDCQPAEAQSATAGLGADAGKRVIRPTGIDAATTEPWRLTSRIFRS
jgi:hypothetical protein